MIFWFTVLHQYMRRRKDEITLCVRLGLLLGLFMWNWPAATDCVSLKIQAQTVTLTQATTAAPAQVQMIPTGTATAQVVQQKLIQQQVVTAATSPQIQTPPPHSPAQQQQQPAPSSSAESAVQQPSQPQQTTKGQPRQGGIKTKAPVKPSGGSSWFLIPVSWWTSRLRADGVTVVPPFSWWS